ncbi:MULTISPECIES: DUF4234 domain-containing protein [unclassified Leucobacter]|uniref:DUF4234 domain-containing protein n=1 Tax=unclassified Leucobacter TaxID=2621730 RepID=UPI00301652BE
MTQVDTQIDAPQQAQAARPYANLSTNRSLVKMILLSIITLGIYGVYLTARTGEDLNTIAGRYDGRRSMNFWLVALLLGPITLGIVTLVWWYKTSDRMAREQQRRGQSASVGGSDFWLWNILGSLIIVGPFIFTYKWLNAANQLSRDFNERG